MYFLIDKELKIVFGWSTKCGCSHIKNMFWYLLNNTEVNIIHFNDEYNCLPDDIENYTTILIIRNPYERIISGFLDKYNSNTNIITRSGEYRHLWKHDKITFSMFVDELIKNQWKMVEYHHFTPQTTEKFNKSLILKSKCLKIYDINNVDYSFIESLYNKKITKNVLQFKGNHTKKKHSQDFDDYVYDLDMDTYNNNFNVKNYLFYNEVIQQKVYEFYKNDFLFFEEHGFFYKAPTP